MRKLRMRIAIGLVLFFGAMAFGVSVAWRLAPARLRSEAEARLGQALGSPVSLADVRVSLGLGIELEGRDARTWLRPEGPALQVDRVVARVRPLSLLLARPRLARLVLEGARLRIERDASGVWRPPPFATWLGSDPSEGVSQQSEALLGALIGLEEAARFLLEQPRLADALELRGGRVELADARGLAAAGGKPKALRLRLEGIHGTLRHYRLRGSSRLTLRAHLADRSGEIGVLEWEGSRSRGGAIRLAMAATALDLAAARTTLQGLHPKAALEGRLSGAISYETPAPAGGARLELDLVAHGLRAVGPSEQTGRRRLDAERATLRIVLAIRPQEVELERARIASGELDLELRGTVERPLRGESAAQLALAFRDVDTAFVRALAEWLPDASRAEIGAALEPLLEGRIATLTAGGRDTLLGWRELFAGRARSLPRDFAGEAAVRDGVIHVGEENRLADVSGTVAWSRDRIEVRGARGQLNGQPLPRLDLTFEGVSHWLAARPLWRGLRTRHVPLRGLRALWDLLRPDDADREQASFGTTLELDLDHLEHPVFLAPLEGIHAVISPLPGGVRVDAPEATWGGVPIRAEVEWILEPHEEVRVALLAAPSRPTAPPSTLDGGWARGRFAVSEMHGAHWRQMRARGELEARGTALELRGVEVELAPRGALAAAGTFDLAHADSVAFELRFALEGGDVSAVSDQLGLGAGLGTGRIDASGTLAGGLRPHAPLLEAIEGNLSFEAREGRIHRTLPAIAAIALASEAFNPFARRKSVRYDEARAKLAFAAGRLRTEEPFSLDGPDMRVLASGEVDLVHPPHEIDAEVALFLFRQIEGALERIPILNLLLLGGQQNLMAAYFELSGPWEDPAPELIPLRSLTSGPGSLVLKGLPALVLRGLEAVGAVFRTGASEAPPARPPSAPPRG